MNDLRFAIPIAFLSAAIGEFLAVLLAALPVFRAPKDLHWTEFARRSWSARRVITSGPALLLGMSIGIYGMVDVSEGSVLWTVGIPLAAWLGAVCGSAPLTGRVIGRPGGLGAAFGEYAVGFLVRSPGGMIYLLMFLLLIPRSFDAGSVAIVAVAFVVATAFTMGAGIPLIRLLGIISAAPPRLEKIVQDACAKEKMPAQRVYLLHWRWANAMAFSFAPALAFTPACVDLLTDEELASICAHELAHRRETPRQKLIRFSGLILALPAFSFPLWMKLFGIAGLIVPWAVYFIGMRLMRRFSQRMEQRADAAAHQECGDPAIFATALEKCYRYNMYPAVMRGKRQTHPHLYDRLVAAGVTPPYPRPKPPSNALAFAGFVVLIAFSQGPPIAQWVLGLLNQG